VSAPAPAPFRDADTFLHRRDPRAKTALFLMGFVYIFLAPDWPWMLLLAGLGLALAMAGRTPWRWLAVLWAINLPSFVALLAAPLWRGSGEVGSGGTLHVVLAWTAAILVSVSLFSTMDPRAVTQGLRGLGAPASAAFTVGLAYRLLFATLRDALRLVAALRLKGATPRAREPLRLPGAAARLVLPVLFAVLRRAPVLIASLELRGYAEAVRAPSRRLDAADAGLLAAGAALLLAAAIDRFGPL
jgi:energy-coupling factor transport system permease protein